MFHSSTLLNFLCAVASCSAYFCKLPGFHLQKSFSNFETRHTIRFDRASICRAPVIRNTLQRHLSDKQAGYIQAVKSEAELNSLLLNVSSKYKMLAEKLADRPIIFAKVLVDEAKDLAQQRFPEVSITPTFHLYNRGVKVDEMVGSVETPDIIPRVRQMLSPWVGEVDIPPSPHSDTILPPKSWTGPDPPAAALAAVEEEEADLLVQPGDCPNEEGCEIVWD